MSGDKVDHVEGVGGRLAVPKSLAYRHALSDVEARALPYVARLMLGSDLAYVLSAAELGLTPPDAARKLLACLLELLDDVDALVARPGAVDIVVQREAWVAERIGTEASDWLHVGRNRGESIRGYLPRLFFRDTLFHARAALIDLLDALAAKAEATIDAPAPVYHHLQHAGVTTLGEWLLSYAGNLAPHIGRIDDALIRLDVAPPVMNGRPVLVEHGERVCKRLGFSRLAPLRQQIHVTEDHFAEPLFALVLLNVAEARLAEDLRLYSTSEFAFFEVADEHASGSSLLPQKKNPFGLQAVIGGAAMGAGRLAGQLAVNVSLSEELDGAFHAASAYQYGADVVSWTRFMAEVVSRGQFDLAELRRKAGTNFAGASEALDILVVEAGVPLRHAHHLLGALVRTARASEKSGDRFAELRKAAPGIDLARLERVLTGAEFLDIALNVAASRAALAENRAIVAAARTRAPRVSPVEAAIDALRAEARKALAKS